MIQRLVDHATTVLLAVICIFLFGLYSYLSMPREAAPDVPIPFVVVSTPYIGVAPADIEGLVTIPLENELAAVRDVEQMSSASAEGVSMIYLKFEPDVVIEDAIQKVRDRVNRARPKLPADVEEPSVAEISFSDMPILIVTIAGDKDEEELRGYAEALQDEVTRVPGVLEANVTGGLTRQIRVQIDPARLAHYGFSMGDVANAIRGENQNIPGGTVQVGESNVLLRVPGEFTSPAQIEEVAVKRVGDRPVFVRDLGRVVDSYKDRETYARMNGEPALSVSVTKRTGANIIEIADEVKILANQHAEAWPAGVTHRVLADQSTMIRDMVSELENNIITALILVVAVILFFMGVRNSLFVAVAIPLSMLASFLVIQAIGFTLNMVVLFSLILALGMLVDNAIVVVENIYRHMEEGYPIVEASVLGTREVAMAVAASTATTVAAFFPLVFWTGIMGEFMGYLPKTLITVLLASLMVAVCILPVATSRLMKVKRGDDAPPEAAPPGALDGPGSAEAKLFQHPIMQRYKRLLQWSIDHRYRSAFAGFAALVGTFIVYGAFNHGTEFFSETQPNRAFVSVRAGEGTDLDTTDRLVRQIESLLAAEKNVDVYVSEVGVGGGGDPFAGGSNSQNQARITVDFLKDRNSVNDGEQPRVEPTDVTVDRLRAALAELPGAELEIAPEGMGPPVGDPISVEVSGEDFHLVGEYALVLQRELAALPGVTDLSNNYRVGRPELRLRIDRGAAKRIGVSTGGIGNAVRSAVAGTVASTLRQGEDEYDILVELEPEAREDVQSVLNLRLPGRKDTSPDTFPIPLSSVASYELAGGSGAIQHIDQDLVVTISGDVAVGYNANIIQQTVAHALTEKSPPRGIHLRLGGADDEQKESQAFLGRAFLIAVSLILMVLVTQFDSLAIPGIILATVVLSLVGVLWGLLITGMPFSIIMTGIGVISLAGVVVNNAIVLLDYVEQLRARGLSVEDALVRAGMTRFRPVMLTAITTVLGLIPMATGVSFDFARMKLLVGGASAEWWGPMAVAVIFGLSFATLLTLVMVPTLYAIKTHFGDDFAALVGRVGRGAAGGAPAAARHAVAAAPRPKDVRSSSVGSGGAILALLALAPEARALTLEQAFQAAESHNADLAMSQEAIVQAKAQRLLAWSTLSPSLITQASYTVNELEVEMDFAGDMMSMLPEELMGAFDSSEFDSDPIVVQPKAYWQGNVTVTQTFFSASALPGIRAAYQFVDAAEADDAWAHAQVRSGVARAYYGLAAARAGLELAEAAVETSRGQLTLAQRQLDAGLVPARARIQAELALTRAEREAAGAREQLTAAASGFARLTGLPEDSDVAFPETPARPATLQAALDDARALRPDLAAAEHRLQAAEFVKRARGLAVLPRVEGRWTQLYTQNTGFVGENSYWTATLEATWLIWGGGARLAQTREAASQQRVAELMLQKQMDASHEEIRLAFDRLTRAERAMTAVEREIALAEESLTLATRAFEAGSATWLEVQQAELGVRSARLSELSERMNRDLAAVDLLVATGRY